MMMVMMMMMMVRNDDDDDDDDDDDGDDDDGDDGDDENGGDLDLALANASENCPSEPMSAEDPLFLLYTSGSTGKPKGLVHSQAGYLLYAAVTTSAVFDCQPGDRFGCVADIGWITGHTYTVYGPLANGATSLLFESVPSYPDPGRYWATVEKHKLTQVNTVNNA